MCRKLIRFHRHYCSCKQFSQHQQVVAFLLLLLHCSTITSSWRTIARTWWWSYLVRIYANSMEPKKTRLMLLQVSITMTWILFIPRLQGFAHGCSVLFFPFREESMIRGCAFWLHQEVDRVDDARGQLQGTDVKRKLLTPTGGRKKAVNTSSPSQEFHERLTAISLSVS